ncbi:MAG: cytochrome c biogenesis protein CcsA [Planctomycetes bacterium]|nr:cytochrome c biogenesis protein CcsA [Planctomycetota bacterium]
MASSTRDDKTFEVEQPAANTGWFVDAVLQTLAALASLKLTVFLFSLSLFLVFTGTLAQQYQDIWGVVNGYFRATVAWIDFRVFSIFFGGGWPKEGLRFPFPGGITIGVALFINLMTAHLVRFRLQARGLRLVVGLAVVLLGAAITALVVSTGSLDQVVSLNDSVIAKTGATLKWQALWIAVKIGLFLATLASAGIAAYLFSARRQHHRRAEMWIAAGVTLILAPLLVWIMWRGNEYVLGDSSMRILWQLLQGQFAALVLLAGCVLAFKRRAGIVLIHAGVALVMVNEFVVYTMHTEAMMTLYEGQAVNYVQDIRSFELAVIDPSDDKEDRVVVVPGSRLVVGETITDDKLPFDIKVIEFFKNSRVRRPAPADPRLANAGRNQFQIAESLRTSTGIDSSGTVDQPSAYVQLLRKGSKEESEEEPEEESFLDQLQRIARGVFGTQSDDDSDGREDDDLGIFLVMIALPHDEISVDGKKYQIDLRFKRIYKTYSIALKDVRQDNYVGTSMAQNYSSDIRLVDPTRGVDEEVHIWMNNPLRFAGETFYQANFDVDRGQGELTQFQVVSNAGWMIPYVACMIVGTGLLAQFMVVLLRFLNRREQEERALIEAQLAEAQPVWRRLLDRWFPWGLALLAAGTFALLAIPPRASSDRMNIHEFGKLPVMYEGRMKPLDTLARNSMLIISGKQTFVDEKGKKQPAIRWLLDVVTDSPQVEKHKVFKVENLEVQKLLNVKPRSGFRYSFDEIREQLGALEKKAADAHQKDGDQRTAFDRKAMATARRVRLYVTLQQSMGLPRADASIEEEYRAITGILRRPKLPTAPRSLPPTTDGGQWRIINTVGTRDWIKYRAASRDTTSVRAFLVSFTMDAGKFLEAERGKPLTTKERMALLQNLSDSVSLALAIPEEDTPAGTQGPAFAQLDDPVDPLASTMTSIYDAYRDGETDAFNDKVAQYHALVASDSHFSDVIASSPIDKAFGSRTRFETAFNHAAPFFYSSAFYLFAFALAAIGWLGWTKPLNAASVGLILVAMVIHTLALAGRMYISGRPPVTNLYSSAVFIGWAAVVFGLAFEMIYKNGVGNVLSGAVGFATLLIAHFLSGDGDTLKELVAVLDTQFWLATHVVTITLGYTTAIVAGFLGVVFIVRGIVTASLTKEVERDLTRMIYGTLCFSILFSFIGTVLGGLWADDSWGRFWGWDPKENGALMIVIWNALVLHARWGGMVRSRGLAVLSVVGITMTAWSWFGTNAMGVGLHSYGFNEGVWTWFMLLGVMVPAMFVLAGCCMPKRLWISFVQQQRLKDAIAYQRHKGNKS